MEKIDETGFKELLQGHGIRTEVKSQENSVIAKIFP